MKKIIKHGVRKKEIKYHFTCPYCRCEFEMTSKDLQEEQQSLVYFDTSSCPDCGYKIEGAVEIE